MNKLKQKFKKDIEVYVIEKNYDHDLVKFDRNVDSLDGIIQIPYNKQTLAKKLEDIV